jgi:hypothetical protein
MVAAELLAMKAAALRNEVKLFGSAGNRNRKRKSEGGEVCERKRRTIRRRR